MKEEINGKMEERKREIKGKAWRKGKYSKDIRKCFVMKRKFLNKLRRNSVYKKSVCMCGEWRMKEEKKETKKQRKGKM